jgi:Protein of unknown function (DUF3154).
MIQNLVGPVADLIGKFVQDKDEKARLAHEIATLAEKQANELAIAQAAVNQQEAAHRSVFVAGWRPFIGWTCGVSLAWHFVLAPMLMWVDAWVGLGFTPVTFDMDSLTTILMGMLGLGGLRTYEKAKGIAR